MTIVTNIVVKSFKDYFKTVVVKIVQTICTLGVSSVASFLFPHHLNKYSFTINLYPIALHIITSEFQLRCVRYKTFERHVPFEGYN